MRARGAGLRARLPGVAVFDLEMLLGLHDGDTAVPAARLKEPFAPLMVTESPAIVAVTPCGRSTGALAILDMVALRYATMHRTSPPCPIERACLSVITPFGVETITVPMPPRTFGSSSLPR